LASRCRGYRSRRLQAFHDDPQLLIIGPAPPSAGLNDLKSFNLSTVLMAVHKHCYTSLNLTRQGGLSRRETEKEQFEQFVEDEKQAFLGDARGQFAIGRVFSTGITMIQKDLVRAHCWLSLAAAQGNNEAARCRDKIIPDMTAEQVDR